MKKFVGLCSLVVCLTSQAAGVAQAVSTDPLGRLTSPTNFFSASTNELVTALLDFLSPGTFVGIEQVATLTALRAYSGPATAILVTDTNRGGMFTYTTTAHATNAGTIYEAIGKGSGTWVRNDAQQSIWRPEWFGATATITGSPGADDDATAIQDAVDALLTTHRGGTLEFSAGIYALRSRIVQTNAYQLVLWRGQPYSLASGGYTDATGLWCYDPGSTNSIFVEGFAKFERLFFRKMSSDATEHGCLYIGRDASTPVEVQANRYSMLEKCRWYGWDDSTNYPALKFAQAYGLIARDCEWNANGYCWELGGGGDDWYVNVLFDNCSVDSTSTAAVAQFPMDDHGAYFANIEGGTSGNYGFTWNGGLVQSAKQGIRIKNNQNVTVRRLVGESWNPTNYVFLLDGNTGVTMEDIMAGSASNGLIITNALRSHTFTRVGMITTNGVLVGPNAASLGCPLYFNKCEFAQPTTVSGTNWFHLVTNVAANIFPTVIVQNGITRVLDKDGYDTYISPGPTGYRGGYAIQPVLQAGNLVMSGSTNMTGAWVPGHIILSNPSNYIMGNVSTRMMKLATNSMSSGVAHTTLIGHAGQVDVAYSNGTIENDPAWRFEVLSGQAIPAPGGSRSARTFISPVANSGGHPIAFAYSIDPYYRAHATYSNHFGIGPGRTVVANGAGANWWVSAGSASTNLTIGNNAGGTLLLSSGISFGSGTSEIQFRTATPSGTASDENTPSVKAKLTGGGVIELPYSLAAYPTVSDGIAGLFQYSDAGSVERIWSIDSDGAYGAVLHGAPHAGASPVTISSNTPVMWVNTGTTPLYTPVLQYKYAGTNYFAHMTTNQSQPYQPASAALTNISATVAQYTGDIPVLIAGGTTNLLQFSGGILTNRVIDYVAP